MEKDKSQLDDQVLYIVSIQIDRQLDEKKKRIHMIYCRTLSIIHCIVIETKSFDLLFSFHFTMVFQNKWFFIAVFAAIIIAFLVLQPFSKSDLIHGSSSLNDQRANRI